MKKVLILSLALLYSSSAFAASSDKECNPFFVFRSCGEKSGVGAREAPSKEVSKPDNKPNPPSKPDTKPDTPSKPDKPTTKPEKPTTKPEKPNKPTDPGKPSKPEKPHDPKPEKPSKPEKPRHDHGKGNHEAGKGKGHDKGRGNHGSSHGGKE